MASTYSDRLKLELMETGANANTWGQNTNTNLQTIDAFNAGYLSKSVAGSADVTLTTNNADPNAEASNRVIEFTGALTGDIKVFVPAVENNYIFFNNTTGSQTLTVAPTGHDSNGVVITQGAHTIQYCTGNKIIDLFANSFGNLSAKTQIKIGDNIKLNANGVVEATALVGNGAGLTGVEEFAQGTEALFVQTTAPTGFTTNTNSTLTECCLQVVTGTGGGAGGADAFSTTFGGSKTATSSGTPLDVSSLTLSGIAAGNASLSTPQIPGHSHTTIVVANPEPSPYGDQRGPQINGQGGRYVAVRNSGGAGGSAAHGHPLTGVALSGTISADLSLSVPTMDLKRVDSIIATKD